MWNAVTAAAKAAAMTYSKARLSWTVCATTALWLFYCSAAIANPAPDILDWAYPMNPTSVPPPAPDDGALRRVPGSDQSFTLTRIRDLYGVPDWHPGDHPPMPQVVARGRKPAIYACGYCHLPNGLGRPENASLAGLPAPYIEQQIADFQRGTRGTAKPDRVPASLMIQNSKGLTNAEMSDAAEYFASLVPRPWVHVIESTTVPVTHVSAWARLPTAGESEPIGDRIIEVPEDPVLFVARDARAGFVAYVPPGSIAKGEDLVRRGGVDGVPCGTCHGTDLRGLGPIPGIAGRSPSYLVRQLYEFQHGIRAGSWSALMAPQVKGLSPDDMISIAAFAASLEP